MLHEEMWSALQTDGRSLMKHLLNSQSIQHRCQRPASCKAARASLWVEKITLALVQASSLSLADNFKKKSRTRKN